MDYRQNDDSLRRSIAVSDTCYISVYIRPVRIRAFCNVTSVASDVTLGEIRHRHVNATTTPRHCRQDHRDNNALPDQRNKRLRVVIVRTPRQQCVTRPTQQTVAGRHRQITSTTMRYPTNATNGCGSSSLNSHTDDLESSVGIPWKQLCSRVRRSDSTECKEC